MRDWRGLLQIAPWLAALVTCAQTSSAQIAIAQTPGESAVEHAELAYAGTAEAPVTWVSLRLRRGPVALVAAVDASALVEAVPNAWFEALEATASPRVLPPLGQGNCAGEPQSVRVSWPRGGDGEPQTMELTSAGDVEAVLVEQGLSTGVRGILPRAERYVLWLWPSIEAPSSARTLRVSGGSALLSLLPGERFPVLVSVLSQGPTVLPGERPATDLDVSYFSGATPRTDYHAQLDAWFGLSSAALLEARTQSAVFNWAIQGDFSVAPLVLTYAQRAARELPELDVTACAAALGKLDGPIPPVKEPIVCGAARDAWLALRGAPPELTTLQRYALSGGAGVDPGAIRAGGNPRGPLLRARQVDDSACPAGPTPPVVVSPPASRPTPVTTPSGPEPEGPGATIIVEEHHTTEVDCSSDTSSSSYDDSDADCSSDTSSSSYDDSDADCSSDTSSSSYDDSDADCSSDTSSSSYDDSDADCSSDTSSSSYDDSEADCSSDTSSSSSSDSSDGCDGGPGDGESESSDDGYDGDTCTGSAAPSRATQKSQAGLVRGPSVKRAKRLKTSLWSVVLVALVLPIRRRKRGSRAAG